MHNDTTVTGYVTLHIDRACVVSW